MLRYNRTWCVQGPKTIHFWAPTFKWAISIANLADLQRPPENVSYPQQIAVTATGLIWSRFSTQINPVRVAFGMHHCGGSWGCTIAGMHQSAYVID